MSLTTILLGESTRKKIDFFVPYVKNCAVLDIGCASEGIRPYEKSNWIHQYIVSASNYCIGIDHNDKLVNELQQKGYNVISGNAMNTTINRKFDAICAFDVIEHIEDLKAFFDNVDRLLKDEGKLLISVPNPWFFMRFLQCLLKGDASVNPDHVYWFCRRTITELLRRYGFKIQRIEFGSGEPRLYHFYILPKVLRHTSIFLVAKRIN